MLTEHEAFEWDDDKAASNLKKHGIDFASDAAPLLSYPLGESWYFEDFDYKHSRDEDRWITTGPHSGRNHSTLRVVWTERIVAGRRTTRIITARPADAAERKDYADRLRNAAP